MIEQIKTLENNVLAIQVIDGFTGTDEKFCQKFFAEKWSRVLKQLTYWLR